LDTDESFSHTFTAAGNYTYFCSIHPHMTGKIIVK
jgi:plastocyanin